MRILLANYRYFVSGGPERYMFAVQHALEQEGHDVIPFSIRYTQNEPTPYEPYFVEPLAGPDEILFANQSWSFRSALKTLERSFYARDVEHAITRLARDTQPDVAYVLHYLRKLSPSLLVGLKKQGVPIVVRISDFLMACPASHCLRDGVPCTLCLDGSILPSVKYRCVKGSLGASVVHYLSSRYHQLRGFLDLVDRFVVPSLFTLELLVRAGWPREKLIHIPTFVSPSFLVSFQSNKTPESYVLYVGHMEEHKGPDVLIRAYAQACKVSTGKTPKLVLVGNMESKFAGFCRSLVSELKVEGNISFRPFADTNELVELYRGALFTVIPSRGYENLPNIALESFACGTAVIGAGHGSIKPLVADGKAGMAFEPGDHEDLAAKMKEAWEDVEWCVSAGKAARAYAEEHFELSAHLVKLLGLMEEVVCAKAIRPTDR